MAFSDAMIGTDDFDPQTAIEDMTRRVMSDAPANGVDPQSVRTRLMRKLLNEEPPTPKLPKSEKPKHSDLDFSSQAAPAEVSADAAPSDALDFTSQVQPAPAPAPSGGITDALHSIHQNIDPLTAIKGAAVGLTKGVGGVVQGAGSVLASGLGRQMPEGNEFAVNPVPIDAAGNITSTSKAIVASPVVQAGKAIKSGADMIPMTPEEKGSLAGRVGEMAGGIAPYAAVTVLGGPALGIAAGFTGMAASTYGDVFEEAKKYGASDEVAEASAKKAAITAGILGSLPLGAGKYAKNLIAKMVISGAAFATAGEAQEAVLQQIRKDYDPKAGYTPEQKRIIAELILGAGMGGLHHAFDDRQPAAPTPSAAPSGGAIPSPPPGAGTGPTGGGPSPNAGTGGRQQPPPGGAGAGQGGPQGGPQPSGGGAGPQPGPQPGRPPPGSGAGMGAGYTMDPATRAKMERVYRHFEPGKDPSTLADHELYNAVNEHLRDTSSTGYTAKEETAEEKTAREDTARRRNEDDILRGAGWTDAHINAMTDEQRAEYVARAKGAKPDNRADTKSGKSAKTEAPSKPTADTTADIGRDNLTPEQTAFLKEHGWTDEDIAEHGDAPELRAALAKDVPVSQKKVPETPAEEGTREAPIVPKTADDVLKAEPAEPTPAQATAENYRHAHMELPQFGLTGKNSISIETGVGQTRKGVDPDGKPWEVTMRGGAYGRIKGTLGADGQPLDIKIGPHPESPHIFVIDQHDPKTGKFDEHKIIAGYLTPQDAMRGYAVDYGDLGDKRIGHVTAMGPAEFEAWRKGDTTKPLKGAPVPGSGAEAGTGAAPLTKAPTGAAEATKVSPTGVGAGVPKAETTTKPVGSKAPLTLLQFIAHRGGIQPDADLRAMDAHKHRVQIPGRKGFFGIVKTDGMDPDKMREAAEETGYLRGDINKTSTVRDLYDLIEAELRGQKRHAEGEEDTESKREKSLREEREAHEAERHEAAYGEHEREIDKIYPGTPADLKLAAAKLMADDGMDVDSAIERAAMRLAAKEPVYEETPDDFDATFEAGLYNEVQRESAHGNGEAAAPAGAEEPRPGKGEEASRTVERVPDAGEAGGKAEGERAETDERLTPKKAATEKGADNKEQMVIPGAEKIGQGEQAQRAANAKLKPKVAQKGMEIGLFGDERNQTDIFDNVKKVEKALGPDADKVAPADIQRAGEIMAANPGIDTAAAFGQAVIKNAIDNGDLTPQQVTEAYGEKGQELLDTGREGASGGGSHAIESGPPPDQEQPGGRAQAGELPSRGEAEREGGEPGTEEQPGQPVPNAGRTKRRAAGRRKAARDEASNAAQQEPPAGPAAEPDNFDDIFDRAIEEQFGTKPKSLDDVTKGLQGIFGKPKEPPSGLAENEPAILDEATYQKALPYLKAGVSHFAGTGADLPTMVRSLVQHLAGAGMDADAIRAMKPYIRRFVGDVSSGKESIDAPSGGEVLEQDRGDAAARDRVGEADVSPAPGAVGQGAGERGEEARQEERPDGGERVPEDYAPVVGENGDLELRASEPGPDDRDAADRERSGSAPDSQEGFSFDEQSDDDAIRNAQKDADVAARRAAQAAANAKKIPFKAARLDNIAQSLPMLFPEQHEDVAGAERRFQKSEGHGMLMTNGTGTGKTYSGLGVIRRFFQQGKSNVIVVAPSQGILEDWVRSARDLGLDMRVLADTMDKGNGFVGTTYANFGANKTLADREWDLVVADEAHKLSSDQDGTVTDALRTLRALTLHPDGLHDRAKMVLRDMWDKIQQMPESQRSIFYKRFDEKAQPLIDKWHDQQRPKSLFLSATPFAYHFSLDWAEGYLFNFDRSEDTKGGYNAGDGRDKFYMQHLGYRMRINKLTKPEAEVDQGVMERQMHEYLRAQGSLSGRVLTVDKDYDRKFVLAHDAVGEQIDRALDFLQENEQFRPLMDYVGKRFDYLTRMRLLEAMKARSAVPFIKQSFALGRKVVVFHDYNEGGGINPFDLNFAPDQTASTYRDGKAESVNLKDLYEEFIRQNPYVKDLKFAEYRAPIAELTKAFPDALIYNGTISKKDRSAAKALFNDDKSGRNLIIVQSAAGEAGISLHDVTGKHQRTLLNLGMPIRPVSSIQQEGRIYRVGQASDAMFRYMNTGTNWERWTFAGKIADRAGTAENLALGNQARAIRQSFIDAFSNSSDYPPEQGEGTGGKEADRALSHDMSEFQKAKTHYYAQQKVKGRRDQREGIDYYATPEPLGYKMVEWADVKPGEKMLEPSAGHGAIARYFPENTSRTLVEPSSSLASRAALQSPGARVVVDNFENLDVGANKFDAIVMNPPFGTGAKTAIDHIAKAMKHLKNGGRIVALIPRGQGDDRLDKLMDSDASKGIYIVGEFGLPPVTFERAGTKISARVVVLEKQTDPESRDKLRDQSRDYSNAETIGDFFDRIEHAELPPRVEPATKDIDQPTSGRMTIGGVEFHLPPIPVTKEAHVDIKNRLGRELFAHVAKTAEANGGEYLRTLKSFRFPSIEARSKFLDDMAKPPPEKPAGVGMTWQTGETTHAKNGMALFVATPNERVPRETFDQMNAAAKKEGGYYSSYNSRGAIPGFQFTSETARQRFLDTMNGKLAEPEPRIYEGPTNTFDPAKANGPLGEAVHHFLLDNGLSTGNEWAVSLQPDGSALETTEGDPRSIFFGPKLNSLVRVPGADLVIHHNHPSGSPLSHIDIAQLALPGIQTIWAHGHNGTSYRASLTDEVRNSILPSQANAEVLRLAGRWNAVTETLMGPMQRWWNQNPGAMGNDEINNLHAHLTNEVMRIAGIIHYETNYQPHPLRNQIPQLAEAMAHAARAAQKDYFNGRQSEPARADRRTRTIRHPGNMGDILSRSPSDALIRAKVISAPARREGDSEQAPRTVDRGVGGDQPRLLQGDQVLGALGDPSKVIQTFKNFWTSTYQPELVSDRALMADPLFAKYRSAQANEKDAIVRLSESEWNYWNKRGDAERIRFLDDVETAAFGAVPSDPRQAAMARRYRAMLDANWAEEKRWGSQAAFVQDYFPHIWERPDEWRAFSEAKSAQMGPTWFQKKRTIDYITDGLAAGLKLKYTNPVDIIVHRLLSGVDMRQRMQLLYALKDEGLAWNTTQGQSQLIDRGWRMIVAPDRKQWVIHPDVQPLWKNAVEAKGFWQDEHIGGSMFRGWMAFKNAFIPIKLAFSAFHPNHVLHINYSNGMARGWNILLKDNDPMRALGAVAKGFYDPALAAPGASIGALLGGVAGAAMGVPGWGVIGGALAGSMAHGLGKRMGITRDVSTRASRAREAWNVRPNSRAWNALTPEQKADLSLMHDGGFVPQLSEQLKIGAKRQLAVAFQKALRREAKPGDYWRLIHSFMRRGLEKMQAPIFERWIPQLKTAAYLDAASDYLRRQPAGWNNTVDRRLALRGIAKSIDNRFGEMFYGNLFWNRYLKDAGIAAFLSLGWNLGFVREFGGAAFEAVSRPAGLIPYLKPSAPRREIRRSTNKIAFAIAYMASAALINGIANYANTGEMPHGEDFIFFRIGGENPDGTPRRVTNMFYLREVPMLLKHIQERGGNIVTGTGEMIYNKMMIEPFRELLTNRDYYGYNIWDENAPVYKQVWQAMHHMIVGEGGPMSVAGSKHAAELSGHPFPSFKESIDNPDKLLAALKAKGVDMSLLGFGPAPAYVEKSGIQNRISYLYGEHVAPKSKPHADEENSHEKLAVRTAILIAKRDHDQALMAEARARGKAIGLSPTYMAAIGRTPTDVYLFSRLPIDDQRSLLRNASPEERARYLPHANVHIKQEINRARYAPTTGGTGDEART